MIYFYTCLGPNCKDYAELLHRSCEATKSGMVDIVYCAVESVGCDGHPKGWEIVGKGLDLGHSSKNHADAIRVCVEDAQKGFDETEDVFVLCDADMVMLLPLWDTLLQCVIVGEFYLQRVFGASNGDSKCRYRDYPAVYFFATNWPECFDFSPEISQNGSPKRELLDDGTVIKKDTGWSLPDSGIKSSGALPRVWSNDPKAKLPFKDDAMRKRCFEKKEHQCEWHYNGQLFASHKQACRSHSLNGSQEGQDWKWRVLEYAKRKGIKL